MSFATPIALALAALAIPIIVFYILKVRMRRLAVSTNLFWQQIYDEKPPRSIWQRFRHLLSLIAQLALLSMLVLAIADPYLPWQLLQARRIVLILDNSASMQATDVSPDRFSAAKSFALDFVAGLRERDEVAIVVAGETPEVVLGMTGHIPTLRRAIESAVVSDKSTMLTSAVRLGEKLVGSHPHGQVLVLTDGGVSIQQVFLEPNAEAGEEDYTNDPPKIVYKLFGDSGNNIGITQFQVRRSLTDPLGYEILASVLNASDASVRCRLEVTLEGAPVDVVPLKLAPGELWKRAFEKTSVEGGTLLAEITRIASGNEDLSDERAGASAAKPLNQLSVDDKAWAILPARSPQKVLLVTPGNLFLRKVFEANPLVELTVTNEFPERWPEDSIIVLHQQVPEKIPKGNVFILDPAADCDLWKIVGEVADPIITQQAEQSPLMTHIRMDNIVVPRTAKVTFDVPIEMLAGTVSDEPVYAQLNRDGGKCLVLLVNLEQSDLAFRTTFPIMVTNALTWFSSEVGQLQPSLSTGILHTVAIPENDVGEQSLVLVSPTGARLPAKLSEDRQSCSIGPLEYTGVWNLSLADSVGEHPNSSNADEAVRQFAVNLSNECETNLRPLEELVDASAVAELGGRWLTRPIWFYLTLLAGLFAGLEWYLYQRRFIS